MGTWVARCLGNETLIATGKHVEVGYDITTAPGAPLLGTPPPNGRFQNVVFIKGEAFILPRQLPIWGPNNSKPQKVVPVSGCYVVCNARPGQETKVSFRPE